MMITEMVPQLNVLGILLLWIESMAVALLFVATVSALVSCLKKKIVRKGAVGLAVAMPLLAAISATLLAWFLIIRMDIQPGWFFAYSLVWTLAFVAGCFVLFKKGYLFQSADSGSNCCSIGRLAATFGIVSSVFFGTFAIINNSAKADLLVYSTSLTFRGGALLPGHIPDHKNALFAYKKAYKSLGKVPENWLDTAASASFDPTSRKVSAFLAKHEKTLELTKNAAAMKSFYAPNDILSPLSGTNYGKIFKLVDLLIIDAKAKLSMNDVAGALANITTIYAMADHVKSDSSLVGSLPIRFTHQGTICSVMINGSSQTPILA
jgi:hypothetical protein